MATAESVKAKLQGLITSTNTKTGKNDTTLTDAVNTLLEGYGQGGGGGGECSGKHIIEVDELPTEDIDETALYKVGDSYYKANAVEFKDIIAVDNGIVVSFVELYEGFGIAVELYYAKTRPTENIAVSNQSKFCCYYVEDEGDILIYGDLAGNGTNEWSSFTTMMGAPNQGVITDISEATADGVYSLVAGGWTNYITVKGNIEITENGSYDVANVKTAVVAIPDKPVSYFAPRTTEELPTDAPEGSIALVFRRE